VQEQDGEIDDVKVRQRTAESGRQAPGQGDHQITEVIHVSRKAQGLAGIQIHKPAPAAFAGGVGLDFILVGVWCEMQQ
jgi:hypothetical protein